MIGWWNGGEDPRHGDGWMSTAIAWTFVEECIAAHRAGTLPRVTP